MAIETLVTFLTIEKTILTFIVNLHKIVIIWSMNIIHIFSNVCILAAGPFILTAKQSCN